MARALDPKAKAKRQKIFAAVGGVILVLLLAWRVPPMIAMMNAKPPTSSTTPPAAPAPGAAPAPAAPVTPGAPVPPTVPPVSGSGGDLIDSDPVPVAGPGQLVSFGRFVSKDPFVQQSDKRCTDSAGVAIACPAPKPPAPPKAPAEEPGANPGTPKTGDPSTKPAARESAQISVNGSTEGVSVKASFPVEDPVFRLVSVGAKTAKVSIDGGSYASGDATITLEQGKPVTLVNTADGTRYRVVLVSTG
jgi:hypothetical protein